MGKVVGNFIKQKRTARGLSQADVAKLLGVSSAQTLSNIERGDKPLPLKFINILSSTLGFKASELIDLMAEEYHQKCVEVVESSKGKRRTLRSLLPLGSK